MENLYVQNPKVPVEKTQGKLDVWFQKLSVPPSQKVFFLRPPPPTSLEIPVKLHTFTKIFGPLTTPPQEFPIPSVVGVWIFSGTTQCRNKGTINIMTFLAYFH